MQPIEHSPETMPCGPETSVAFGRFRALPDRKALLAGGEMVPLGARAFDILMLLIAHRHRFVTRDEIRAHVWRGLVVADNNVSVQVWRLRRALGEQDGRDAVIVSLPGHGYRFVASVVPPAELSLPGGVQAPSMDVATRPVAPPLRSRPRAPLPFVALSFFCMGLLLSSASPRDGTRSGVDGRTSWLPPDWPRPRNDANHAGATPVPVAPAGAASPHG